MRAGDVARLACPGCRGPLAWIGQEARGRLSEGELRCGGCGARWPVEAGLPKLYREQEVRGTDRLLRVFYDHAPGLHDVVTEIAIRLLQATTSAEGRERYMRRLELGGLQPRADGQPIRILEIGVGTGTSLPLIRRALPSGLEVEIWGVDLSAGMMGECRKRLVRQPIESVRLLLADAHSLPFPDKMFDRVLEVGGTGGYRDPARALREMVRVARPGARIVIADEQLDQSRPQPLFHRLLFRLQTFYTSDAHCPVELLPGEVTDVLAEQITRYFYCLSFRLPPEPSASATN